MLEPIDNQYLRVGYIARSHGVNGEVLIISELSVPQLFDEIDLVHMQNTRGDLIPARIESVRVQEKDKRLSFFVKFEHVTDRNQAEKLKNCTVYVNRSKTEHLINDEDLATDDYTFFKVYDENDQYVGQVSGVIENPAHPILEIVIKDAKQLLVPLVDEYISSVDKESNIIRCQNLNQLTDKL